MPNWVYNHLAIEGNDSDIIKLKNQLNTPITRDFTDYKSVDGELQKIAETKTFSNPVFAFWNIIKPEDMHAYIFDEDTGVPDNAEDSKWAMPLNAIKTLSTQYPSLKFTLSYEEETSWGGEVEFTNGNMVEINEYEFRCECGEEYKETPELDDDGQCPECAKEEVNG